MEQHIKTYSTEAEWLATGNLIAPYVAFIEDYNGSGDSGIHLSEQYHWAEQHFDDDSKNLLNSLLARIIAIEERGVDSGVYLSTTEYEKLKNGEEAVDENGDVITTAWDASGVTYYVYEESTSGKSTDSQGTYISADKLLTVTNATVDEDEHTLILTGGKVEDGTLIFTQGSSSGGTVEGTTLEVSESQIQDTTALFANSTVDDTTLII